MDWIGQDRGMTVTPILINNHCSTVDAVSLKMIYELLTITVLSRLKVSIRIVSGT